MPGNQADGYIYIDLQLRQDEFEKRLAEVEGKTSSFASKIKNTLLAIGIGAMAKKAAGYIYDVGSTFEATMSKVQAITGATGKELEALTEKAKELGASTKYSAPEVAEAMTEMAKAGWTTQQILDGMSGVLDAAAASGEDLATTSTIVADAITGFGLAAKDSTRVADLLTQAANAGTIDIADLGETFKYIAPVAKTMGLSIEDVTTAISAMSMAGIKGSQAGTSLRTVLARMVKPTDAVAEAMDELGIVLTNQDGSFKSLDQIVAEMRKSFSGLTDEQKTYYATILAGQEGMSGLLAMLSLSQEEYDKIAESMDNCNGVAQQTAEIMQNNLSSAVEQMGGALETIAISIYEQVSPALQGMVGSITDVLDSFNQLITGKITFQQFADEILRIITELGPQLLNKGIELITQFSQGFVAGYPAFMSKWYDIIQGLGTWLSQQVPIWIQKGFEVLSNFVQGITDALPVMIEKIPQIITTFANIINDNFPTILMKGAELLLQFIKGILSAIPTLIANIPQIIEAIWSTIMAFNWLNLGKSIIDLFGKGIKSLTGWIGGKGKELATSIWNSLTHLPQTLYKLGKDMISRMGSAITNTTGTVKGAVKGVFDAIVNGFKSLPSQMLQIGKNIIEGLWNGIGSMKDWILGKIGGFADSIVGGIKDFFGIHSPSKVMADLVGKFLPPGIAVGFETAMPQASKDMLKSTQGLIDDFQTEVNMSVNKNHSTGDYDPHPNGSGSGGGIIDYDRLANSFINALGKCGLSVRWNGRELGRLIQEV